MPRPTEIARIALPIGAVALVTMFGACASGGAAPPAGTPASAALVSSPELIAEGQAIFAGAGRCAGCHGEGGQGGRAPSLSDDDWLWVDGEGDRHAQIFAVIKDGVSEPRGGGRNGMPAMGGATLTDAQIHALTFYVESL